MSMSRTKHSLIRFLNLKDKLPVRDIDVPFAAFL
jgi:hypothetical protein